MNGPLVKQIGKFLVLVVILMGVLADFSLLTIFVRALVVWAAYTLVVSILSVVYNYWQLEKRQEAVRKAARAQQVSTPAPEAAPSALPLVEAEKE